MKIKRSVSAVLAALLAAGTMPFYAMAAELPFKDVAKNSWYYNDVKNAYEIGLINGRELDKFEPEGNLTYAEAVKLAACMHQTYTGAAPIQAVTGADWYVPYVEYCRSARIIFKNYNWNENATREVYMDIFSRALPADALSEINNVEYGMVPDVPTTHEYAYSIYLLYRAGIVRGMDDQLTCKPASYVTRSEVAAILTRMMDDTARITLELPEDKPETNGGDVVVDDAENNKKPTTGDKDAEKDVLILPWTQNGAKPAEQYTLADIEKLSQRQREVFLRDYPDLPATLEWLEKNNGKTPDKDNETDRPVTPGKPSETDKPTETDKPSETEKNPTETESVKPEGIVTDDMPWEKDGAKQPEDYTKEEYMALTTEQKAAFEAFFPLPEEFDAWLVRVGLKAPEEVETEDPDLPDFDDVYIPEEDEKEDDSMPWLEPGAKAHGDYTKADYDKLNNKQKELFLAFFENPEDCEAWMIKYGLKDPAEEDTKPSGTINPDDFDIPDMMPWDQPGGKMPEEYTAAEYNALTPEQKQAFQDFFPDPMLWEEWAAANGIAP
ncbi:MAG: hypothetical protein E7638_01145 [Ruminococcaceae bacterium]|nr:hypothetical protein [Oscillospiraceae bacterium]